MIEWRDTHHSEWAPSTAAVCLVQRKKENFAFQLVKREFFRVSLGLPLPTGLITFLLQCLCISILFKLPPPPHSIHLIKIDSTLFPQAGQLFLKFTSFCLINRTIKNLIKQLFIIHYLHFGWILEPRFFEKLEE